MVLLRRGEGKYLRREVTLGRRTARWAEVHSGLFPGDYVVTTGRHLLASLFDEHDVESPTSARHHGAPRSGPAVAPESPGTPDGTIPAQGTVEVPTAAKTLAASRIDGRIRRILVHHGQHVEAGQVLAEVESLHLHNLQLDLLQALTELRWKEDALARIAPLAERAAQPQAEVRKLRAEVEVLRHRVESLQRRLQWIGLSAEDIDRLEQVDLAAPAAPPELPAALPVRAPQSGRVGEFRAVPGQAVAAEDPLFEIHDVSRVWVKLLVFEHEAPRIALGDAVQLGFAAHPSLRINATIVRRGAAGTEQRPLFPLWVELPNPDGLLREGMMAFAVIHGGDPSQRPLARTGPNVPRGLQE
jgi:cobalt-zinc-cadmium efflux system membrane fusion protein